MTFVDIVNAGFEGGGACLLAFNVRRLLKDKQLAGVSLFPTVWWNLWGFWNVYFYYAVSQPASFYAGIGVLVMNTIWVALALYYRVTATSRNKPPTSSSVHARNVSEREDV